MAKIFTRADILDRFRKTVRAGRPLIGGRAGNGPTAKLLESGGIDFITACSTEHFRLAGHGSLAGYLPYGNANSILMEIAPEILQVTSDLPVLAGVSAADPFRSLDLFLSQIHAMGFAGVQNSPTVGLYDGFFRRLLEDNGIGYDLEVKMVRIAHERDMLSCPCVFNIEEARMMALAGADMMIIHLGLPSRGSTKETDVFTLEGVTSFLDNISDSARRINPDLLCLGHAGPVREPADIEYVLKNSHHTHGFYHIFEPEPIAATMPALQLIERLKNIKINT